MSIGYTGWTQTSANAKTLDVITRRCYNATSQLLVTQHIGIWTEPVHNPAISIDLTRFQRRAIPKLQTVFSMISTEGLVIDYIETIGKFNSRTLDINSEIASVTYDGDGTSFVNDLVIPISTLDGVYIVGDIV